MLIAEQLVLNIYHFRSNFPKSEMYGLTSQLRRAAVSVPANIAEGFKKRTSPDKLRFFNIAQGSLEECRYYLILVKDLNYGDSTSLMSQLEEVSRLLIRYSKSILNSNS
ncbi:four helix bundle protein [Okeania sp. SIO2C2]|uniref:four helix bundle protein n=1 Tax=Okeania sp. SIO2C2 TaxID=2607787 RepID=UPI00257ABA36|nr:four helix bundle protein [Okeania sp. SIO2C2]